MPTACPDSSKQTARRAPAYLIRLAAAVLAMTMLSGCEVIGAIALITYSGIEQVHRKIWRQEQEKLAETLREKIEAGDLDTSQRFIMGVIDINHSYTRGLDRRRAAEIVLEAYQNDPDPELDKLAYLIKAHGVLAWRDDVSPDEKLAHRKAILQLAQSKKLWDYANVKGDHDLKMVWKLSSGFPFREPVFRNPTVAHGFRTIQDTLSGILVDSLEADYRVKVSDPYPPYPPFVCDFTSYERELFLINARKWDRYSPSCTSKPCDPCRTLHPTVSHHRDAGDSQCVGCLRDARDSLCRIVQREWESWAWRQVWDDIKSGDLAAAERCVFECEKFKGSHLISFSQEGVNKRVNRQRCLAARRIISAYENAPKLNARQKEALKIAHGIPSEDCTCSSLYEDCSRALDN